MLLTIIIAIIIAIYSCFIFLPIGNEQSTVRRVPIITFTLMALNVVVYFVTMPGLVDQNRQIVSSAEKVLLFLQAHPKLLADEAIRNKLLDAGFSDSDGIEALCVELGVNTKPDSNQELWLRSAEATQLRTELTPLIKQFDEAAGNHLYRKYGISPNGKWKIYQLITWAFLHGGVFHLFSNLLFFFAVGFSLEDLWGRGTFLAFYLGACIASALPSILDPSGLPVVGASGAVSATMGAFLVRLYRTRITIWWFSPTFTLFFLLIGKKPWGKLFIPAFFYVPLTFLLEVLIVWLEHRVGATSDVAHSAHFAGFVFGALFAATLKGMKIEETHINPKIEAKVSFAASPVIAQSLEALDKGNAAEAERTLKTALMKSPNDLDIIMALIQVYQTTENYEQLNAYYSRLIRHHLSRQDREAALYAYDNLLSAFPDNQVAPHIPARDWLTICEYLSELNMTREAAVEFERMAKACPNDPVTVKACMLGGEAALAVNENKRALQMFEYAMTLNPPTAYASRIHAGIEKVKLRMNYRATNWLNSQRENQPTQQPTTGQLPQNPSLAKPPTSPLK